MLSKANLYEYYSYPGSAKRSAFNSKIIDANTCSIEDVHMALLAGKQMLPEPEVARRYRGYCHNHNLRCKAQKFKDDFRLYENNRSKFNFECLECSNGFKKDFISKPSQGCPDCSKEKATDSRRMCLKQYHQLARVYDCELVTPNPSCSNKPVTWLSPCGVTFRRSYFDLLRRGPPTKGKSSLSEAIFGIVLYHMLGNKFYKKHFQYKSGRLELDFKSDDNFLAIEVNGEQHFRFTRPFHRTNNDFKEQQHRDTLKKEYCQKNFIRLITIRAAHLFPFANPDATLSDYYDSKTGLRTNYVKFCEDAFNTLFPTLKVYYEIPSKKDVLQDSSESLKLYIESGITLCERQLLSKKGMLSLLLFTKMVQGG